MADEGELPLAANRRGIEVTQAERETVEGIDAGKVVGEDVSVRPRVQRAWDEAADVDVDGLLCVARRGRQHARDEPDDTQGQQNSTHGCSSPCLETGPTGRPGRARAASAPRERAGAMPEPLAENRQKTGGSAVSVSPGYQSVRFERQ